MKRFKNILVVASDDPGVPSLLAGAIDLAVRNDGRVTLFGHVDSERTRRSIVLQDGESYDVGSLLLDARHEELEHMAARVARTIDGPTAPVEVVVAAGRDFVEVIRTVATRNHDLVMVGSAPASRFPVLAGSSLAMHLLRKCPVPVWVSSEEESASPDVAVAVGPFDDGVHAGSLDVMLLEIAASLAARRGGKLHVVHAWTLEGESLLRRGRVRPPAEQVDAMVVEEHKVAKMGMKRLLEFMPDFDITIEQRLERGEPADAIRMVLDAQRPGVLVMGTLARAGLNGVFIGNTAERVLGTINASVLAVKPEGFQTPVAV
jgi:nucleotide-binding universal stress UspA family protein